MKKAINTPHAPQAIGPYSQAVTAGNFLFISGQIPMNLDTNEVVEEISEAAHQVMKNLQAILKEAGGNFSNVVKTTIFLKDMKDFAVVNDVYASYFDGGIFPARETVQVAGLPRNVNIEISMIASL
ncbi:MAG: RidA family protein [Weeksellaceae bacterium]